MSMLSQLLESGKDSEIEPSIALQVIQAFGRNPEYGGPIQSAKGLLEEFRLNGWQASVLSSYRRTARSIEYCPPFNTQEFGIPVYYLGNIGGFRWTRVELFGWAVAYRLIKRANLVVVHGFRGWTGTVVSIICRVLGKRCWMFSHGMVTRRFRSMTIKWIFDRICGDWLLSLYEKILVTSESECLELANAGVDRRRVAIIRPVSGLQEPIDLAHVDFKAENGLESDIRMLLTVGRVVPIKNIEAGICSLAGLPDCFHFVIVGPIEDRSYHHQLVELSRRLRVEARVHFVGAVFGPLKWSAIDQADCCLLLSHYENFGHFASEVRERSKSLVISKHCGYAETVKCNADDIQVVDPSDELAVVNAVRTIVAAGEPI